MAIPTGKNLTICLNDLLYYFLKYLISIYNLIIVWFLFKRLIIVSFYIHIYMVLLSVVYFLLIPLSAFDKKCLVLSRIIIFFRKLFTRDNVFVPRKCFHCDHFCINRRKITIFCHITGGRQPTEDKSLKITFFDENLKWYCINFLEYESSYNFYKSWEVVSEFLTVFQNSFVPNADLRKSKFKCSFTIVNRQIAQEMVLLG